MEFVSTRGGTRGMSPCRSALLAEAPDGGLYVPSEMPRRLQEGSLAILAWLSHGRRFAHVMEMFWEDASIDALVEAGAAAFGPERYGDPRAVAVEADGDAVRFRGWQDENGFGHGVSGILPPLLALCKAEAGESGEMLPEPDPRLWPHILSQAVCVISAYCEMVLRRHIRFGDEIDVKTKTVAVDDMIGVWMAKFMGAPVRRILCECGPDSKIPALLDSGVVTEAGNMERIVFHLAGPAAVRSMVKSLDARGKYELPIDILHSLREDMHMLPARKPAAPDREVRRLILC